MPPTLLRSRHLLLGRPVETWVARIGPGRGSAHSVVALLSTEERQRMSNMVSPVIQRQYAAGRALTRLALGARLSMPARRVPVSVDDNGRPCLLARHGGLRGDTGPVGIDFNLSHSGDLVAVAVGSGLRIGLDIEREERRPNASALARRFFSSSECELLERSDERCYSRRWHRIWTTREAHAKARGIGVRAMAAAHGVRGDGWDSRDVRLADGYVGTVVALRPTCPQRVREGTDTASASDRTAGNRR